MIPIILSRTKQLDVAKKQKVSTRNNLASSRKKWLYKMQSEWGFDAVQIQQCEPSDKKSGDFGHPFYYHDLKSVDRKVTRQ